MKRAHRTKYYIPDFPPYYASNEQSRVAESGDGVPPGFFSRGLETWAPDVDATILSAPPGANCDDGCPPGNFSGTLTVDDGSSSSADDFVPMVLFPLTLAALCLVLANQI